MGLTEDLDGIQRDTRSIVDRILDVLPDDESEKLLACLRDPQRFPASSLATVLSNHGHKIGRASIQTWRDSDKVKHPEIYEGLNVRGSAGGTTAAENAKRRL